MDFVVWSYNENHGQRKRYKLHIANVSITGVIDDDNRSCDDDNRSYRKTFLVWFLSEIFRQSDHYENIQMSVSRKMLEQCSSTFFVMVYPQRCFVELMHSIYPHLIAPMSASILA